MYRLEEQVYVCIPYYSPIEAILAAFSSYEDSFSLINIESQACGTPIVTFSSTGLIDTVDNKCGYAVLPNDVDEMYRKVQIIRHNLEYYSMQCRQYVLAVHDKDVVYDSYIKLYGEIFHRKLMH